MNYINTLFQLKPRQESPKAGLFHYLREYQEEKLRVHLRIDPDGTGTLILNASSVMHLNPSATMMARLILEGEEERKAVKAIQQAFQVSRSQALADYQNFLPQFAELLEGGCPIHELDLETRMPFSARPSAPYRMDMAVTYRCNNDCGHCYNARARSFPELGTEDWKRILDVLWGLGVPHVVFTGGEATLRNDLPVLIRHAERNRQITGLNTNARRLADKEYVGQLVEAGLDHVQVTVESWVPEIHDEMMRTRGAFRQTIAGLQNALDSRMYVMTNTTMLQNNIKSLPATLDFLAELGVPTVGLNALIHAGQGATVGTGLRESELQPILEMATRKTAGHGQKLIWYTPTQYCQFDPSASNLGVMGCTAALYSMCLEPNGDVLPCQSYYKSLGNILSHPWEEIWNHSLSRQLRERHNLPAKCEHCTLAPECGGGCPLKFELGAAV